MHDALVRAAHDARGHLELAVVLRSEGLFDECATLRRREVVLKVLSDC